MEMVLPWLGMKEMRPEPPATTFSGPMVIPAAFERQDPTAYRTIDEHVARIPPD